jgi:hypothetical protein
MSETETSQMHLLHPDGTVSFFLGRKLSDSKYVVNRFLCCTETLPVVIGFDISKNHGYWKCSCGGYDVPFHACKHLMNLELVAMSKEILVLDADEFSHYEQTVLKDVMTHVMTPQYLAPPLCSKCCKKLPMNSGHCPCGTINAIYDSQLQELGQSVGFNPGAFQWEDGINPHKITPQTKLGDLFPQSDFNFACDDFTLDPKSGFCLECGYKIDDHTKKTESKIKATYKDLYQGDFEKPKKTSVIAKMGKKRHFPDKDEDV